MTEETSKFPFDDIDELEREEGVEGGVGVLFRLLHRGPDAI